MKELDNRVLRRLKRIRAVAMDVDGVLTDGGMYYGEGGEVMKRFHVHDGMGISMLRKAGFKIAWITAEETSIVKKRAWKLQIDEVYMGVKDKGEVLAHFAAKYHLSVDDIVYIGDDVNDIPAMKKAGLAIAVADAVDAVKSVAMVITEHRGGEGAIRELADMILEVGPGHKVT